MQLKKYPLYPVGGQREPFIDFLKGVAILGVIWLHCMPLQDKMLAPLWCGMSVTIFLLIQIFHAYKYGASSSKLPNLRKIYKRIVLPMLIVTCILAIIHWQFGIVRQAGGIVKTLKDGGFGPGCYYPWLYLQFAFLIPLVGRLQNWLSTRSWGGVIFLFSIIAEIVSSISDMPEWLWRILFLRYSLLLWLGYDVVRNGIRVSRGLMALSVLSIAYILVMHYIYPDLSPLFIHNGWKVEHWPAYFYPAYLLIWLIRLVYDHLSTVIKLVFAKIGVASYEMFLCQMFFFAIVDSTKMPIFDNRKMNYLAYLLLAWCFSVGVGMFWKYTKAEINDRKINCKIA